MRARLICLCLGLACSAQVAYASIAFAQAPTRIRGTVSAVSGSAIHVVPKDGGEDIVALAPTTKVTLVTATSLDAVKAGGFVGVAAKTLDDGSLVAREVHVFPESMRGAGEGHRPFDLGPNSTMTNGTVGQEVVGTAGQTLTVRYKGGETNIVVPTGTPIVALSPGNVSALKPGEHVIVFAQVAADHVLSASAMLVGVNGLVPPM